MRLPVLAALLLAAPPAFAQTLTDGNYRCVAGTEVIGNIVLRNGTYAGPTFERRPSDWHPFAISGDRIIWRGPLDAIEQDGAAITTILNHAGDGQAGFDITVQAAGGEALITNCFPAP